MADRMPRLRAAAPYLVLVCSVAVFVAGGALFAERAGLWGAGAGGTGAAAPVVEANRLDDAVSPYLRMHADNPVHWQPWGEAAFARAREEDKPIFLSIGYYTCYWCHVMEREAFTDPGVAETLNRHFVPIKVDREQRPGVDALYMRALHVMGERGGWPLSIFLTPELEPFSGATYLPTQRFSRVLDRLREMWSSDRQRVDDAAARVVEGLKQMSGAVGVDGGGEIPAASHLDEAYEAIAGSFRSEHGGFSDAPKFPQPSKLAFLLRYHERTGEERALEMARTTLDAMAAGGIHDQIGGGFHRYATDARWRVPHFEKMLYGNAQLLSVYTHAWRITGEARYREVAAGIVEHLDRVMTDPDTGLFYSAQSSLVDGVEGRTYIWTRNQLAEALDDAVLTEIAVQRYGLDGEPEMSEEDAHVLYRARSPDEVAERLGDVTAAEVRQALGEIDRRLLDARREREQPSVGDKHVLAWNAQTIAALAEAGQALDESGYIDRAVRAAEALHAQLYDADGGPWHAIRDGRGQVRAQLIDYATLVEAHLALAEATGEAAWRERAAAVADDMIAALWDEQRGVLVRRADPGSLLVQIPQLQDGAMPAGNSVAAGALARLAGDGETRLAPYAATALRAHEGILDRRAEALPRMLTSLMIYEDAELPRSASVPGARADLARAGTEGTGEGSGSGSDAPGVQLAEAGGGTPASSSGSLMSASKVDVSAAMLSAADGPRLEVRLEIDEGWHVNANPASLEFLIPTEVTVLAGGEPLDVAPRYPEPIALDAGLGDGPISVYEGEPVIEVALTEEQVAAAGEATVRARVQACNDTGRCLAPATIEKKVSMSGG